MHSGGVSCCGVAGELVEVALESFFMRSIHDAVFDRLAAVCRPADTQLAERMAGLASGTIRVNRSASMEVAATEMVPPPPGVL
jgi:hypothetical protein